MNKHQLLQTSKKILVNLLIASFFAINTFFITYNVFFSNRIIPGVKVGNIKIGGLTPSQAQEKISQSVPKQDEELFFAHKGKTYQTSVKNINLNYDLNSTIQNAVQIGRSGNFIENTKTKFVGLTSQILIKPTYSYDETAFQAFITQIDGAVNTQKMDATFIIQENELKIVPEIVGNAIDIKTLTNELKNNFENLEFKLAQLPISQVKPDITSNDLQILKPKVENIINSKIVISGDQESFSPTKEQILSYVKLKVTDNIFEKIQIDLDETKTADLEFKANMLVYQAPRAKVTKTQDNKVLDFEVTKEGVQMDKEAFVNDFKKTLLNEGMQNSSQENSQENIQTETKQIVIKTIPTNTPNDKEKFGIKELLGTGTSKYVGSIASREKNIELATQRINGVLVPPGELFSFNKNVGEISAANGYAQAYVILGGKTVLGDGGGVCQVSTTVFRAALNSGLQIVTRNPHAYRVYYYEQESPIGFDAAIFQPSLDFVFKNDTKNYILIQTYVNSEEKKLTYEIYGTSDGRKVEISKPVVTDQIAPPAPVEYPDPNLPAGTRIQTEHATWGARVNFNRKVTDANDQVIHTDNFASYYKPWGSVFMVGTR